MSGDSRRVILRQPAEHQLGSLRRALLLNPVATGELDHFQVGHIITEVFQLGHDVGDIAIQIYDDGTGTFIKYSGGSLAPALAQTQKLMSGMFKAPVFEATLQHDGVLVRQDVLLPDGDSWRVVEVKASTRVKPEYLQDCAVQAWVHQGAGYPLSNIALAHIDNQFVYQGDGNYQGLLVENDLTEKVMELQPMVSTI